MCPQSRTGLAAEAKSRSGKNCMKKVLVDEQAIHHCGIDVSGETLAVAVQQDNQKFVHRSFENRASGHKELVGWLQKRKGPVQVSWKQQEFTRSTWPLLSTELKGLKLLCSTRRSFIVSPRRSEGQRPMLRTLRFSLSTPAGCPLSCGQHPARTAFAFAP